MLTTFLILNLIALLIGSLMQITFIRSFLFFIDLRVKALETVYMRLSYFNVFIIGWCFLIIFLEVWSYHSIFICQIILCFKTSIFSYTNYFMNLEMFLLLPILALLSSITILYLFYHQGNIAKRRI